MNNNHTSSSTSNSSKPKHPIPTRRALLRAASVAPVVLTAPNLAAAATASALDCLDTPPGGPTFVFDGPTQDNVFRVQVEIADYELNSAPGGPRVSAYINPNNPSQIISLAGDDISGDVTLSTSNPNNERSGFAVAYVDSDGISTGTVGHVAPGGGETLAFNSCLTSINMS